MGPRVLCLHRLHLRSEVHAVTGALTHGEDLAHILRVIGKGPEVVDSQNAIEDQAVVANVRIQGQHLDQLGSYFGIGGHSCGNRQATSMSGKEPPMPSGPGWSLHLRYTQPW